VIASRTQFPMKWLRSISGFYEFTHVSILETNVEVHRNKTAVYFFDDCSVLGSQSFDSTCRCHISASAVVTAIHPPEYNATDL
jgi:hypothetical protein